jgi:hypothetical protein
VLENVKITYRGGGTKDEADIVPPYPKDYSPRSLGPRPAAAFYIRHVTGLTFRHVEFAFETEDQRPPLVAFDVNGLELDHFTSPKPAGVEMMRLEKVNRLTVPDSPGLADRKADITDPGK